MENACCSRSAVLDTVYLMWSVQLAMVSTQVTFAEMPQLVYKFW